MKKLKLKKIVISNLDEASARNLYGGVADTFGSNCTKSCTNQTPCACTNPNDCHTNACASGPGQANCTVGAGGCTAAPCPSANNGCFTQLDCTYGHCTVQNSTCPATYLDASCPGGHC